MACNGGDPTTYKSWDDPPCTSGVAKTMLDYIGGCSSHNLETPLLSEPNQDLCPIFPIETGWVSKHDFPVHRKFIGILQLLFSTRIIFADTLQP